MGAKILVVEDDPESLKLIGLMLHTRGYQVLPARNGPQALQKAVTEAPDLVLMDVMMPGMDGYEVARRLRADPRTAHLPIIMLTARGQVTDKVAGFEAGADEYLVKPVHPAELFTRIEALLARTARLGPPVVLPRGKSIGILGCKGGVGTSTVAINLAFILARGFTAGKKVLLMDVRIGSSTLALQLGLRPQQALKTLAEQATTSLTADTVMACADRHASGFFVLAGLPDPSGTVPSLPPAQAEAIVRSLEEALDFVLVDMGTGLDETNRTLLRRLRYILIVTEPQRISLLLTQALLATLDNLEIGKHRIGIVLMNKTPTSATPGKEAVENFLQQQILCVIPPAPELAFQAAERGMPMVMLQPESLVAVQFRHLAEHLVSL
ncbi:MAG: response regulator [Thermoflexia bacterium]|nr:MAG: response regulator [Thermoflexia bacterium]